MDEPIFTSSVHYRDPKAALAWLERAFGFEITMAIDGPPEAPEMCHYEMSHEGRGRIMVGAEWTDWVRSPASVGGANTQSVHVQLAERARRALRAGACRRRRRSRPSRRTSSTATAPTAPSTSRVTAGRSRPRSATVTRAEAEAALGQPIIATQWA